MTTLAEMLKAGEERRRVRVLRNLQISDVSSVDRGAGRGVKVILTKRDQGEDTMAKRMQCPHCQYSGESDEFEPNQGATVGKVVEQAAEAIAKKIRNEDPRLTLAQAMAKVGDTAEFSRVHRAEKLAKFGAGF